MTTDNTDTRNVVSLAIILAKIWPILAIIFTSGIVWATLRYTSCDIDYLRKDVAILKEEVAVLKTHVSVTKEKLNEMSADIKTLLRRAGD